MLGVDFAENSVNIVEAFWDKREAVLRLTAVELAETRGDPTELAAELRHLTFGKAGGKKAVVAAESSDVTIRNTLYPVMSMKELRQVITWDIASLIPFEPGSYYYDFAITGTQAQRMKVLVAAVRKESVDVRVQILRQAGLIPVAVDIEPLAVYRMLNVPGNILIISIGSHRSWITIFENHVPVIYRHIFHPQASSQENSFLSNMDQNRLDVGVYENILLPEIRQTLEYYQILSPGASVSQIVCLEKQYSPFRFTSFIENKTGINTTSHDPLHVVRVDREIPSMNDLSNRLSIAVGLAAYGGGL